MRHDEVKANLRALAFDFFFWFSRFEFALKEANYLRSHKVGDPAEPSWSTFVREFRDQYQPGQAAQDLLAAKPERQIVGQGKLDFEEVQFNPGVAELDKVVALAKTVRNNLFHGGKHGSIFWDNPARMELLLGTTIAILGELARVGGFEADYLRDY